MALKIRALAKFPARILGANGLSITKTNGVWTLTRDDGTLTALPSISASDTDNLFVVVYNSAGVPTYARASIDVLLTAVTAGMDATLVAIAGLTPGADQMIYWTGADTAGLATLTAAGRALLDDASAAAQLTTLGISAFAQTILDDADAAAVRTTTGAAASGANTDLTSVYLNNTGLKVKDTNASHGLTIVPGSDLTADRTYTITTGDADRTVTLSGNPTLNDWFNQSVKTTASPTFANMTMTGGAFSGPTSYGFTATGTTIASYGTSQSVGLMQVANSSGALAFGLSTTTALFQNSAGSILEFQVSGGAVTLDVRAGGFTAAGTIGVGYRTGAGGTVTQLTSKSTGVTLNKTTGQITLNGAALAADTTVSFTLTNSTIASGDIMVMNHISTGTAGAYLLNAQCGSGTASVNVRNITAGSLSEAIVIAFAVIKAVTS